MSMLTPRDSLFDVDHFFRPFWGSLRALQDEGGLSFAPRVDIKDKKDHYEITADLPGVAKDDVTVTLDHGILTIAAETNQENKEEKEGKIVRQERRYGKLMRSFIVGDALKEDDLKATFKNGVLTLTAKKVESELPPSRRIEIS